MYKSAQNCKFQKLLDKDILTFLGLYYRDASLITLYLVVIGISITKKSEESDKNLLSR